jgi:hypothetical protein
MDIRETRDRAVVFGLDVLEGGFLVNLAVTALQASHEFYAATAGTFQNEASAGDVFDSVISGTGLLFYASISLGGLHALQNYRERLNNRLRR